MPGIDVEQACGGFVVLVKTGLRYGKANELPTVKRSLNGCCAVAYLRDVGVAALRMTGVYFTPPPHATETKERMLTGKESRNVIGGREIGRIPGGDFNRPSWNAG